MHITYISWAESCSRSDNTARELGGSSHKVYMAGLGSNPLTILLKYAGQSLMALRILFREKPGAVFVMSPPVIAVLSVYFYCLLKRVPFVIDAHTAAFLHPRWLRFQWLQRFLSRKAATTIVTNTFLKKTVEDGGGHATILRDVPVKYEVKDKYPMNGAFNIATVCSFNPDEPILEIFRAAKEVEDIHFYMTGDTKFLAPEIANEKPENVKLTGFIPDSQYGSLISDAGAVLTLTTRDHTMLRGAYEAIYQGTPVIISDWPLLKESFSKGAIHTNNTAEEIIAAANKLKADAAAFQEEALALQQQKLEEFAASLKELKARIGF